MSSMNGGPPVVNTMRKFHSSIWSEAGSCQATPAAEVRSRIAASMSATVKQMW